MFAKKESQKEGPLEVRMGEGVGYFSNFIMKQETDNNQMKIPSCFHFEHGKHFELPFL